MTLPTKREPVSTEERYRVVIVRNLGGKRSRRWRWAVEDYSRALGWRLKKDGWAWSRAGAGEKARTSLRAWFDCNREEWLIVLAGSYQPTDRTESPLAAVLLEEKAA